MLALDFVINPKARRVQAAQLVPELRRRFAGRRIEFYTDPSELREDPDDDRVVVAVGGDGTINRVLNSPQGASRRIAVLPFGTSNDLATHLRIPRRMKHACDLLEHESFRTVDLIQVNGWRFATCGGIGFAVDVAAQANAWKESRLRPLIRLLGPLVYPLAAARQLASGRKAIPANLTMAGRSEEIPLSIAMVSNQSRFGKRFSTSPEARNDDGVLDLGVFGPAAGVLDMARIATLIYRARPDRCPQVRQMRSQSFTLTTDAPVPFFGDGEVLGVSDRFEVEVKPGALRIVSPPLAEVAS